MTRIKVKAVIWDRYNVEHIKKHSISILETKIAVGAFAYHEKAHSDRYLTVGRSGKRILSVVLKRVRAGAYYVVTARDSSKKERKKLYAKENKK